MVHPSFRMKGSKHLNYRRCLARGRNASAFDRQIGLRHATTDGEHAISRENRTASKQPTALPVRETQLRLVQRVWPSTQRVIPLPTNGALTAL